MDNGKSGDNQRFGVAVTLAGIIGMSPNGVLVGMISADIWTIVFWRGLLMAAVLAAYLLLRYRSRAAAVVMSGGVMTLVAACSLAVALTMFVVAVHYSTIANTLFIMSSAPLFAAAYSRIFLREAVAARTWVAALLVIVGMGFVVADGLAPGYLPGSLAALCVAAGFGGAMVALRHARLDDAVPPMMLAGILVAVLSLPAVPAFVLRGDDVWLMGLLGLVVLPVSFALISTGPRYISAPEVSLIALLEAVFGSVWAWLVLSEVPTATALAGGAIILATLSWHFASGLRVDAKVPRPKTV